LASPPSGEQCGLGRASGKADLHLRPFYNRLPGEPRSSDGTRSAMRVLICGGGVIGASIAYFLSCRRAEAIVIERTGIACAASGKSGGFLALDWCDGSPLEALARRSFALHASLADRIGRDWGYRRLTTYGGSATAATHPQHRPGPERSAHAIDWLAEGVLVDRRLGSADTT